MSTERLTRAHRRKLEKEAHVKLDLDNLANIDIQHLEDDLHTDHKDSQEDNTKYDIGEESDLSSVLDSEDDQDESSSDDSSDEESDDDLEELLLKAQKALKENNDVIGLENAAKPKYSLPKLNPGISVQKELYIKKTKSKPAKLVDSAVEFVASDEKPSNKKASLVVVANKDQEQRVSKKERQAEREKTTGKGWFDMGKTEITPEVKRDLQVLKMRHILDRKRHYKKMGSKADPKYFQIGTVIESPTEFFSARMTKKERKQNIVDELMANDDAKQYYKRKFNEVQERTNSGGKKHYKKLKAKKQWAK